jgi:predicted O-methyltransferase YrrM
MLSPQVKTVLDRLYEEDAAERAAGLPSSQRKRNVEAETGQFLCMLARATEAWSILEIGSSNGVSTIWLAVAALEGGGHVFGLEIDPLRAEEAKANLEAAGLADVATVRCCDALAEVPEMEGPFDLVFIDAEKQDYALHIQNVIDLLKPNGLIVADNVISHDISDYQQFVRDRADVETIKLPLNRGLEFSLKLRA